MIISFPVHCHHTIVFHSFLTSLTSVCYRSFTDGVGDRHWKFGNTYTYGDLYRRRKCSESPSSSPSESPSISAAPSQVPSLAPSLCGWVCDYDAKWDECIISTTHLNHLDFATVDFHRETYLTSESLNIALVIDLSFSTYEKSFSATDPVGDLNGDGKANTILDAQVAAIEELLINIYESPNLDNR